MSRAPRIPRELREFAREAHAQGWTITIVPNGHLKWTSPDGVSVQTAATPGDRRSALNSRTRLRRKGLRI